MIWPSGTCYTGSCIEDGKVIIKNAEKMLKDSHKSRKATDNNKLYDDFDKNSMGFAVMCTTGNVTCIQEIAAMSKTKMSLKCFAVACQFAVTVFALQEGITNAAACPGLGVEARMGAEIESKTDVEVRVLVWVSAGLEFGMRFGSGIGIRDQVVRSLGLGPSWGLVSVLGSSLGSGLVKGARLGLGFGQARGPECEIEFLDQSLVLECELGARV
uniref:Uncharacterized protein n=1 Tax=Cannabis sativa TaxID=3483 RepID=A0A803PSK4_CANSA